MSTEFPTTTETVSAAAPGAVTAALTVLRRGEPVAMPSETVYGLFADASDGEAVARIFRAKGRPRFNPLIAHVADLAAAEREGVFSAMAVALAERFWPGPLTLVVPRRGSGTICDLAAAGLDTIGLRAPHHPFLQNVLTAFGKPLSGPSANRSGHISPTSADAVKADLAGRIPLIVDDGPTPVGIESTILAVSNDHVRLLRPGAVTVEAIEQLVGPITEKTGDHDRPEAPGMLASHYAPATPVRRNARQARPGEALLAFGPDAPDKAAITLNLSRRGDLTEAAANLFSHLRALDAAGATAIAVMPIPLQGLGLAINDRLARAAAPRPEDRQNAASPAI